MTGMQRVTADKKDKIVFGGRRQRHTPPSPLPCTARTAGLAGWVLELHIPLPFPTPLPSPLLPLLREGNGTEAPAPAPAPASRPPHHTHRWVGGVGSEAAHSSAPSPASRPLHTARTAGLAGFWNCCRMKQSGEAAAMASAFSTAPFMPLAGSVRTSSAPKALQEGGEGRRR